MSIYDKLTANVIIDDGKQHFPSIWIETRWARSSFTQYSAKILKQQDTIKT